jgi:hypothetical protein
MDRMAHIYFTDVAHKIAPIFDQVSYKEMLKSCQNGVEILPNCDEMLLK